MRKLDQRYVAIIEWAYARLEDRYNDGYTGRMKTTVSIPDDVFAAAEDLAARLHMSRSELYATAIREYLTGHRHDVVTEQLDAIYVSEPGALDPELARLQAQAISRDS